MVAAHEYLSADSLFALIRAEFEQVSDKRASKVQDHYARCADIRFRDVFTERPIARVVSAGQLLYYHKFSPWWQVFGPNEVTKRPQSGHAGAPP